MCDGQKNHAHLKSRTVWARVRTPQKHTRQMALTPKGTLEAAAVKISEDGGQGDLRVNTRGMESDHSSQEWRKKEPDGSQEADDDEQPEEYPVDDHGDVLPVFLHLQAQRGSE